MIKLFHKNSGLFVNHINLFWQEQLIRCQWIYDKAVAFVQVVHIWLTDEASTDFYIWLVLMVNNVTVARQLIASFVAASRVAVNIPIISS